MHLHNMELRECDAKGCGYFGAPRGDRQHNGVDLAGRVKGRVFSPVSGRVTKVGYAYSDDLSFRYVQITSGGYDFRVFYVAPFVGLHTEVLYGDLIGTRQALGRRYPGITEHVHFEIIDSEGHYIDPTPVLVALKCAAGGMPEDMPE